MYYSSRSNCRGAQSGRIPSANVVVAVSLFEGMADRVFQVAAVIRGSVPALLAVSEESGEPASGIWRLNCLGGVV